MFGITPFMGRNGSYWFGPRNVPMSKIQNNRIAHSTITPIHSQKLFMSLRSLFFSSL